MQRLPRNAHVDDGVRSVLEIGKGFNRSNACMAVMNGFLQCRPIFLTASGDGSSFSARIASLSSWSFLKRLASGNIDQKRLLHAPWHSIDPLRSDNCCFNHGTTKEHSLRTLLLTPIVRRLQLLATRIP
jgi:hypothetical protein